MKEFMYQNQMFLMFYIRSISFGYLYLLLFRQNPITETLHILYVHTNKIRLNIPKMPQIIIFLTYLWSAVHEFGIWNSSGKTLISFIIMVIVILTVSLQEAFGNHCRSSQSFEIYKIVLFKHVFLKIHSTRSVAFNTFYNIDGIH